jgi:preprotein translocase subunit YajC
LGIILALLLILVSVGGCYPATTITTGANGSTTAVTTGSSSSSIWLLLAFIVILFGLMYFFTIRPQRKKQQETIKMLQALQRGDKIITNAGIYGQIESVYEDSFLIKTDSGTLKVAKWAVVGKQPEETTHS